jgi:hypothetical protein
MLGRLRLNLHRIDQIAAQPPKTRECSILVRAGKRK